jgi:hypothetical protein
MTRFNSLFYFFIFCFIASCGGNLPSTEDNTPSPVPSPSALSLKLTSPESVMEREIVFVDIDASANGQMISDLQLQQVNGPAITIEWLNDDKFKFLAPNLKESEIVTFSITATHNTNSLTKDISILVNAFPDVDLNIVKDSGFRNCLSDPFLDQGIETIQCDLAHIDSLAGIEQFNLLTTLVIDTPPEASRTRIRKSTQMNFEQDYSSLALVPQLTRLEVPWLADISRETLSALVNLTHLRSTGFVHIKDNIPFENMHFLKSLVISPPNCGDDLYRVFYADRIKLLKNLEELELSCVRIYGAKQLANLINLKYLGLHWNYLDELDFFKDLKNLKVLTIHHNRFVQSVQFTTWLYLDNVNITSQLETLSANIQTPLEWEFIKNQTELKNIEILDASGVNSLSPFSKLKKLESLHYEFLYSKTASLESFVYKGSPAWPNLKQLKLVHFAPSNLEFHENMPALTELSLDACSFWCSSYVDMSLLDEMKELRLLKLQNVSYEQSIEAIGNLSKLKTLHLTQQLVDATHFNIDGSPLSQLTQLEDLTLSDNQFSSLDFLTHLHNLRHYNSTPTLYSLLGETIKRNGSIYPELTNLSQLVSFNAKNIRNPSVLKDNTALKSLTLTDIKSNIDWINTLTSLEQLTIQYWLEETEEHAISFSALDKLEWLSLQGKVGNEIESIKNLPKLKYFRLETDLDMSYLSLSENSNIQRIHIHDRRREKEVLCPELLKLANTTNADVTTYIKCEL